MIMLDLVDKYVTRPKVRSNDDLLEFDVTQLASWRSVCIFPYIILVGLVLVGVSENVAIFQKWGDEIAWGIWILIFLVPLAAFAFYFFIRKRNKRSEWKESFPRFHTIDHYNVFVLGAGILAIIMTILAPIMGKEYNGSGPGYAGLFFMVLITTSLYWLSLKLAKTESRADWETGRKSSWSPDEEKRIENELKKQLIDFDRFIEGIENSRWTYPCRVCNGRSKLTDTTPPVLGVEETLEKPEAVDVTLTPPVVRCENPKCKEGKTEWANDGQEQAYRDFQDKREKCIQELSKIGATADADFITEYLSFNFKWFTDSGLPEGDLISSVQFDSSGDRLKKFRDKNSKIFVEWQSFKDGADASQRYVDNIAKWGVTYVSNNIHNADSRELQTLSYSLYNVVRDKSLSELQQVELCLAAAQSLIKERNETSHPPISVSESADTGTADVPKMERVKGVTTLLWQITSMWTDKMSREEREMLQKKAIDWHERSQLIDDDDPEGTVQECFQHIQELDDWWWDTAGQNLESDARWGDIVTEALSAREHSDLIKDMESLNEINVSRNVAKYNDKFERIQKYKQMFDDHNLMNSERKEFKVSHYPKFPTETLIDGEGTCDDVAILFAALLNDCGYPVKLFRSVRTDPEKGEGECMGVAVTIEGADDSGYFDQSNSHKGMIYCEATTAGISCAENVVEDVSGIRGLKMIEV
jgi:hypothetical protein